jgi:hypothetical protein
MAAEGGMSGNLRSPEARWRGGDPMMRFDRLPGPLRRWLAGAALPWSAASALRIWNAAACPATALTRLQAVERATLRRQARRVWGSAHPAAQSHP